MRTIYLVLFWLIAGGVLLLSSCAEDFEYTLPEASTALQNDCIKRTPPQPYVVGNSIQFAYAMALAPEKGRLLNASVEASIAGADGTYLEHRTFYTNSAGNDVGIVIGEPSVTVDYKTEVVFTVDTCAATLRYNYVIPEEARGKQVSFKFIANASSGETVTYQMGPYQIAKMELKREMVLSNSNVCYFSIADMAAYNAGAASEIPGNIDLVYLFRRIPGISFEHAFVSPAAPQDFLPGVTLPSGVNNDTRIIKTWGLRDQHLALGRWGEFIDDVDFEEIDFTNATKYAINLRGENGLWLETEDKKYRAYLYVNMISPAGLIAVSIKRYTMY